MNSFLARELQGWQPWEVMYTIGCTAAIGFIASYLGDTPLGISSAIAGTLYTMLAGKGKISCYIFGVFNTAAYGYISFKQRIYGDMTLNWAIYLPMMFAGFFLWSRQMDEKSSIIKTRLSLLNRIILLVINIAAIAAYAFILRKFNAAQPLVDAATTIISISAMVLTLKRCIEQWLLWSAVNLLSVIMWLRVFFTTGGESAATLIWWMIMLISGIIFYLQWKKTLTSEKERGSENGL